MRGRWFVFVPRNLSTVVIISPRAYISALSSRGLPSFKLSFLRSAFRRFLDDLLREGGRERKPVCYGLYDIGQDKPMLGRIQLVSPTALFFFFFFNLRICIWFIICFWPPQILPKVKKTVE